MLQDQSRNRTPMPAAQPLADRPRPKPRRARAEAGIPRMLSEKAASKAPSQVPVPGSPEAIELFGAACRAVDLASLGDAAELEALRINDGCTLWTSDAVRQAQSGDFSRFNPADVEAAKTVSSARLDELLVMALRREVRMVEAVRASGLRQLYALAFPEAETTAISATIPGAAQQPATAADPRLAAMVRECQDARRMLNDPSVPDGPEADAIGGRETRLLMEILRFPSQTVHDLRAKLPFLREEAEDAGRGWDARRGVPFQASVPGAAWAGLLRDIEHLAYMTPAVEIAPDPIFAAIEASKAAHAARDAWAQRFNGGTKLSAADFAEEDKLNGVQSVTHDAVIATVPTTAAGRLALLEYLRWQMGLYGMADGSPPVAGSAFWPDAYKALKAALAFDGEVDPSAPQQHESAAPRNLSKEAFDYAYGLDLSEVSFQNLWRLYEVFLAAYDLLWPAANESMFDEGTAKPCCEHTPGGLVLDAEANRLGCLRDAVADELRRRMPRNEAERCSRLEVLVGHEIRREGRIRDKALLAELNAAWGA